MTNIRNKPEPPWTGGSVVGIGAPPGGSFGAFGGGGGGGGIGVGGGGGGRDPLPWSTGSDRAREAHSGVGPDIEVGVIHT